MAKKTAAKKSPGLGSKWCPKCGKKIAARSMSHDCGWVGEPKAKAASKPGKKAAAQAIASGLGPAIAFIQAAGSLDAAERQLAELRALKGVL